MVERLVVVAAGFGAWRADRHLASARWADVLRVRTLAPTGGAPELTLALTLRDGSEFLAPASAPGFAAFVSAAEASLPGMLPSAAWLAAAPTATADVVLFERPARRA